MLTPQRSLGQTLLNLLSRLRKGNSPLDDQIHFQSPFISGHPNLLAYGCTRALAHWLAKDPNSGDYISEAFVKITGGVRYQIKRWSKQPQSGQIIVSALDHGLISPRPYRLTQKPDPSTERCALAAYYAFAMKGQLEPRAAMRTAFGARVGKYFESPDWLPSLHAHAIWEGLHLPHIWDAVTFRELIESLRHNSCRPLADLLTVCGTDPQTLGAVS